MLVEKFFVYVLGGDSYYVEYLNLSLSLVSNNFILLDEEFDREYVGTTSYVINENIYTFGGYYSDNGMSFFLYTGIWVLNTNKNELFRSVIDLPTGIAYLSVELIGNKLYFFGGSVSIVATEVPQQATEDYVIISNEIDLSGTDSPTQTPIKKSY